MPSQPVLPLPAMFEGLHYCRSRRLLRFPSRDFLDFSDFGRVGGAEWRGKGLPAFWNGAGLLGLQMRQQCLLVAVPEARGLKLAGLAVKNMLGQREHVRRNGEVGQVAEVILRRSRVGQAPTTKAIAEVCINASVRSVERIASPVHADRVVWPLFRLPSVDRPSIFCGYGGPSSTPSCLPQRHYRELMKRGSRACLPSSKPRSWDRR
jgi:hypothetical protein